MLYIILICLLWRIFKRIKAHCKRYPYTIADYQQHENPIEAENYSIADYLPETIPKEEQAPDYYRQAEIERLQAQKQEYMVLLDCIEREQNDLQTEYKQASVKRRSAISSKLTSLASRHAATNRTLSNLDSKIEKLYNGGCIT